MRSCVAVALVPWVVACSSGSSTDDHGAGSDASSPDGGSVDASGHDATGPLTDAPTSDSPSDESAPFAMTAIVSIKCDPVDQPLASCTGGVDVHVEALTDGGASTVNDVTVTANGMAVPLTTTNGEYLLDGLTGLAPSYEIVVSYQGASISTTFPSPSDFSFTLSPNPPVANMPATITYTPNGAANVVSGALVYGTMAYDATDLSDNGQLAIPASAFPASGSYIIGVSRELVPPVQMHLCDQCSPGGVLLARELTVTVQ